ncbi:hypothetical protein [Actinoplanes sp. NPDC049265]|uniref:hypothetical protein n=1 Tax=Actinoplanes sp. NPDC049265 TaxID=3363902 RepID=UPI00370FCD21
MAATDGNSPSRLRPVLAAVLTILILAPAGMLFFRVWQQNADERDGTEREQQGVEYLGGLAPLISALTETQSSALQGVSAAPASLTSAVGKMAAIDQRIGADLGTRERWTGLRDRINQLGSVTGDPLQIYQANVEVTNLTLALYKSVADSSTLSRDPDNDLSHLQQAFARDLPNTTVMVSRMGDLALMLQKLTGSDQRTTQARATLLPQFGASVLSVNDSVAALTDNLQAAVDDTESTTLSGSLVTTVDAFRRGVEAFIRGASPGGSSAPNAAAMATAQSQLQTSLASLSGVLVREMRGLLDSRIDRLDGRRIEAIIMGALAVLLALAVVLLVTTGRRATRTGPAREPLSLADSLPNGRDPFAASARDSSPPYGTEVGPDRRERSGALR